MIDTQAGTVILTLENITFMSYPQLGIDYNPICVKAKSFVFSLGEKIVTSARNFTYAREDTFYKFLTPVGVMWLHDSWLIEDTKGKLPLENKYFKVASRER